MLKMAGNKILTFDKQPRTLDLSFASFFVSNLNWCWNCRRKNIIFEGISYFLLWIVLRPFSLFAFSHLNLQPASRTCKLDANYRGELNAPVGLVSHPPTLSIFNSFFSVYAVFCGSLWCVDIYKSVCQRYMLALVCFSPMVPEIFFIHSIQLAQQPNKN